MVTLKEKQNYIGNKLFAVDFTSEEGFNKLLEKLISLGIRVEFAEYIIGIRAFLKVDGMTYEAVRINKESALRYVTLLYLKSGTEVSNPTAIINEKLFGITYDFTTPEGFNKLLKKVSETLPVYIYNYEIPQVNINNTPPRIGETIEEALINATYEMLK